jgi:hypothetical protein
VGGKLDWLVTDHGVARLLECARLTEILAGRRVAKEDIINARLASLQREAVDASDKLKRSTNSSRTA